MTEPNRDSILREMKKRALIGGTERIDLLRTGAVVSSLAGAFGNALRETRLTAMLGYLIALKPERFCEFFGFPGKPLSVSLETRHESDRSDILIETTRGRGLVEAKVTGHDPFEQSMKYPANWRVLLTEHLPSNSQNRRRGVKYFRWRGLLKLINEFVSSTDTCVRFVSRDLRSYLEEHALIETKELVEIYAREINEEDTLALLLKGRMYGCYYQRGSRLPEARYFAPHFGQAIARNHPSVHVGISYIARVERVEVVESWKDLLQVVREVRGQSWLNRHMMLLRHVRDWDWIDTRRSFLFLAPPRLVFNPPVRKETLQKGTGFLSRHFFSFDTLFAAWGC